MSMPVSLDKAPQNFLDQNKWGQLRTFASDHLIALTFLNSPYPDPDNPCDFFFPGTGSLDEAVGCYHLGRELHNQCRRLLTERKLLATGVGPNGLRKIIKPEQWHNVWPMFATNRATGPDEQFDDVEIVESTAPKTLDQQILLDCMSWLAVQTQEVLSQKKRALLHQATNEIGANLTHCAFNAAYKAVLGLSRGRPMK